MEGFPDIGGGSSGGGSSSAVAASFLQLPLPTAASSAPELVPQAGEHGGGSPLSFYRLLAGPPSSPLRGHHDEAVVRREIPPAPADAETVKAKIMSHPLYPPLLASYLDCQKVGAPPDVLNRLSAMAAKLQDASPAAQGRRQHEPPRADPELDQFMVAYCNMLVKYREEMARPIHEATEFFKSLETQLDSITDSTNCDRPGSSKNEQDTSCPEEMDPCTGAGTGEDKWLKDKDLKLQLLRKYGGGCMGSLRQGFCKRRKKGKLPKESRQKLLQWWELHDKWPYPSEAEKMALVESTGLDLRQINNWFINQRKRHWKPPASAEDIAFSVMDGALFHGAPQATTAPLIMADGMYRPLGSS